MKRLLNSISAFQLLSAGAVLSLLCASIPAQGIGGGSSNNPNNPGRTSSVSHSIRGKIFLPSGGLPERRMRVVLEMNTGAIAGETFSDSVGNFEFRSLANGVYKVSVPSDNQTYETSQEVVEVYGSFSRAVSTQIYLKAKGEDQAFLPKDHLLSVADQQEVPKAAKKAYEKGLKRAQENRFEEAASAFQDAVKLFPEYLHAQNKLGEQYTLMGKPAEAQAAFEKTISANPKYALPHINLGLLFANQKRYLEAIAELEQGNKLDDSFPVSHLHLGLALMSKPDPDLDRAEKELTRSIDLGKQPFFYVRKFLFNLNVRRQRLDKAAEQLELYLKQAPNAEDAEAVRQMLAKVRKSLAQKAGAAKN